MIKIGNAQGFWGDSRGAPARLVEGSQDLDYLTMDYLAEVSMSILAIQREKDPSLGYPQDFLMALRTLAPFWQKGKTFKVVANAGGLNPKGCAEKALEILKEFNLDKMKIGVVTGDDVFEILKSGGEFPNLDTGESLETIRPSLVSANAYLGAAPIVEALEKGADIVITGRVADPSLTTACCLHAFQWSLSDYNKVAQATVAGHLIECGTQVTGGISTNWLQVPNLETIGFPILEMHEDASFVITKPENTGGCVTEQTVKEQLLYEIGDPDNYISPDAIVSFLGIALREEGKDRMRVIGAKGRPPPSRYKVSATFRDGYMAEGMLTLFGNHLRKKALKCGEIILERIKNSGYNLAKTRFECLGSGDVVPGVVPHIPECELKECVLRMVVSDPRKEAIECFSREIASLVTAGAQGTTGYTGGRPGLRRVFGFWPCLIDTQQVKPVVDIMEVRGS